MSKRKNLNNLIYGVLKTNLPQSLQPQALAIAQNLSNERKRAIALAQIAGNLSFDLQKEALNSILDITEETALIDGVKQISSYLPAELQSDILKKLSSVSSAQSQWFLADILEVMGGTLPDQLNIDALTLARNIPSQKARVEAMSSLLRWLADDIRNEVIEEVLIDLDQVSDEGVRPSRVTALVDVAKCVPSSQKIELLVGAFQGVKHIQNPPHGDQRRAEWLSKVVTLWEDENFASPEEWPILWMDMLRFLMRHRRSELLRDLNALAPLIIYLADKSVIYSMCKSVYLIGRWWP